VIACEGGRHKASFWSGRQRPELAEAPRARRDLTAAGASGRNHRTR
jgi:hypothetical protein